MKRLFDLSEEILQLETDLDREDLTDQQRDALIDAWLEAQGNAAQKIDNYAAWIEECESMAEQRRYYAERMRELARADENRAKRGKDRLQAYFKRHNLERFKTPRFTVYLQQNGGARPVIIDILPESLPAEYQVIFRNANKDLLRARLEEMEASRKALEQRFENKEIDEETLLAEMGKLEGIPGVRLGERGVSIRIK